jgi:hypothetical protein
VETGIPTSSTPMLKNRHASRRDSSPLPIDNRVARQPRDRPIPILRLTTTFRFEACGSSCQSRSYLPSLQRSKHLQSMPIQQVRSGAQRVKRLSAFNFKLYLFLTVHPSLITPTRSMPIARLASQSKLGFYATPIEFIQHLPQCLTFDAGCRLLDTCCTEGEAPAGHRTQP